MPAAEPFRHCISIHALRVEGDLIAFQVFSTFFIFLSTPSGWRATYRMRNLSAWSYISIHALRVEGDHTELLDGCLNWIISIHALRVEGDTNMSYCIRIDQISIHALRVEGDPN